MSADLVQRLRDPSRSTSWAAADRLMGEAADRIEADESLMQQALAALTESRPLATEDDCIAKVRAHSAAIAVLRARLPAEGSEG